MSQSRLLELDALRGFAAVGVVLYHYFYRYNQIYHHASLPVVWARYGEFGVLLFFMISGFVIYWTLDRVERPMDFLVARFSRLYPVFWVSVILTFSVVYIFGLHGREVPFSDAMQNLLMFHEYLEVPHVDGVYWTLTVELTFYFWICILYVVNQFNKVELWFLPIILLSILVSEGIIKLPELVSHILILNQISFFVAGICFYKIHKYGPSKMTLAVLFLSLFSTISTFSMKHFLLFCIFYLVFYLSVAGRLKLLSAKPFVFFGSISYSLYLVHGNIGYVIINEAYKYKLPPILGIMFASSLSVLLAYVFTIYIEKPALRALRQAYKHNNKIQRIVKRWMPFGNR